jgi:hypothetical protein
MLATGVDYSIDQLRTITDYSIPTIRQAISVAQMQGHVVKIPGGYPAKFKAITEIPTAGQTLIIKEAIPPLEISRDVMSGIRNLIMATRKKTLSKEERNKLPEMLAIVYLASPPEDRSKLKDFLINFAEVIRVDLEGNKELDPSDIKVKK